jgi:hypothetical protein
MWTVLWSPLSLSPSRRLLFPSLFLECRDKSKRLAFSGRQRGKINFSRWSLCRLIQVPKHQVMNVIISLSLTLSMALGAGMVCSLTQWYFRDFSPAFLSVSFRVFFLANFFFSSRLIISLECVKSSSYWIGRFDLRSSPDRFSLCNYFCESARWQTS